LESTLWSACGCTVTLATETKENETDGFIRMAGSGAFVPSQRSGFYFGPKKQNVAAVDRTAKCRPQRRRVRRDSTLSKSNTAYAASPTTPLHTQRSRPVGREVTRHAERRSGLAGDYTTRCIFLALCGVPRRADFPRVLTASSSLIRAHRSSTMGTVATR